MTDKIVVFSSCDSAATADALARGLVEARLAACVNIVPGARSVYRWNGKVEESKEWLLIIKSSRALARELIEELKRLHTYQVPEAVAIPIVDGSDAYLEWLDRELR